MSDAFNIKRNDTSPSLVWEITSTIGTLLGSTVVFNMKNAAGTVIIARAAASFDNGGTGVLPSLIYNWIATDTAASGKYFGEFEVTYADGRIETFPNNTNIPIVIAGDIS